MGHIAHVNEAGVLFETEVTHGKYSQESTRCGDDR